MKRISGIVLIILAIAMIVIGSLKSMLPPILTGVGFVVIGLNYLRNK